MHKIIFFLVFLYIIVGCEKNDEIPIKLKLTNDNPMLKDYFIHSMAFDLKGNLWIGTFKQGLIKYNENEILLFNSDNSLIPDSMVIYDIKLDTKGNVWFGGNGLFIFNGEEFFHYHSGNSAIPEDWVHNIEIDLDDNIWFTSCRFKQGGLVKYDGTDFKVFTPDNSELPVHSIQDIAVTDDNTIWVALSEHVTETYLIQIKDDKW